MKCCEGLSGADLKSLVKEAGFAAFTDINSTTSESRIKMVHFEQAFTNLKPCLTNEQIREYEVIYDQFLGAK
ncbi:unnamed protein product [Arabis nemorensis]|uniref:AAA ATPase AAA+ lid domain-containing protein n=1 Tax=Arabis nemorensis TaxID=586526 RepID=A0A565BS85_9BRAS|nr:unnamed protein product [Arabis nemorensis]